MLKAKNYPYRELQNYPVFNTRATFISAFKKFADVTPSYFIKKK